RGHVLPSATVLFLVTSFLLFFIFCFFFYCSVAHRDLHSFPTRRSSDLVAARKMRVLVMRAPLSAGLPRCSDNRGHGRIARAPAGDRKSTRLNSSHRTISYAVFCLKKKKKKKRKKNTNNKHQNQHTKRTQ